jgi:hypothetical protein
VLSGKHNCQETGAASHLFVPADFLIGPLPDLRVCVRGSQLKAQLEAYLLLQFLVNWLRDLYEYFRR